MESEKGWMSRLGQSFRKLLGYKEMRLALLGLDAGGKTTILYKLQELFPPDPAGEKNVDVPMVVIEEIHHKNVKFRVWDVDGSQRARSAWRFLVDSTDGLVFVVDSLDRERIDEAAEEFQSIVKDKSLRNSAILVLANKQDMKTALSPVDVCVSLDLHSLRNHRWHIVGTSASTGEGLHEGLDWLTNTLNQMQARGLPTCVVGESGWQAWF
ncbi:hypothetical protein Mapa_016157 [Marchantia paleacea]|nr:hypothetical protein Mapa_016157 [Marchantia paleacea]